MSAKKKYPEPFRRPEGKIYYFMFTGKDGVRRRISTGETAKERARDFIRDHMDGLRAGATTLSFAEYAEPYFVSETCPHFIRYRQEGKSIGLSHLSQCRSLLERHVLGDKAFSNQPMAKLKRGDLLDLRRRLQGAGMGTNTVNKCISVTKTILSEASFRGDIESNPGSEVGEIKYQKTERDVLSPEEIGAFLAFLGKRSIKAASLAQGAQPIKPGALSSKLSNEALRAVRDEALLTFLFCTGMRAGEIRVMRWSVIDMKTGRCAVEIADKGKDGIGLPKWNKLREIYLAKLVLERLKAWKEISAPELKGDAYIFKSPKGKHFGYEGLHNVLETALAEAIAAKVIPKDNRLITSHSARHSLNTNLLASGVAPLLVQSYLGWSSAESRILTRVQSAYTHIKLLRVDDVAKAVDLMYAPKERSKSRQA